MSPRHVLPLFALALFALPAVAATPAKPGAAATKQAAANAEPRIYLSWKAPYGTPGAVMSLSAACDGRQHADTLYLSVDPGLSSPDFRGVSATLYFHAAEGATLGDYWKTAGKGLGGSPLEVTFESDPERDFTTFASPQGAGAPNYDYVSGSGRLRMIYAFAGGPGNAMVAGKLYGFARVIVRHGAEGTNGCADPMCVEWHSAKFAYSVDRERNVNVGDRWVSLNSPEGKVCEETRAITGAEPWKPGKRP